MTPKERLTATLRGEKVDRPAVSFYEINGLDENPADPDPYNIFSDPSWYPLIQMAAERSDRIVIRGILQRTDLRTSIFEDRTVRRSWEQDGSRFELIEIDAGGKEVPRRTLRRLTRRDRDAKTVWTIEHLLKDQEDAAAYLDLPLPPADMKHMEIDPEPITNAEEALGDTGIVMLDTPDPLCMAASLFAMETFTLIAFTEGALFRRLLDRFARLLYPRLEAASELFPGRLWRIYGPEYATEPYLPPSLFREYAAAYDVPMVRAIHRHGGIARIHSHGRLAAVLDSIAGIGADALDPIEPPPQGDVELSRVREMYGDRMVLFGNIEASDIVNLPAEEFSVRAGRTLEEGVGNGEGRGFVLMPSACPYGRRLPPRALRNYEILLETVGA